MLTYAVKIVKNKVFLTHHFLTELSEILLTWIPLAQSEKKPNPLSPCPMLLPAGSAALNAMESIQKPGGAASLLLYMGKGGWGSSHAHTLVFVSALTIKAQVRLE